jgi:fringe protein
LQDLQFSTSLQQQQQQAVISKRDNNDNKSKSDKISVDNNDENRVYSNRINSATANNRYVFPTKVESSYLDYNQNSVTGTPKPPTTELDDIFVSVKTTKNYHDVRLAIIVKTWFQLAKDQVSVSFPSLAYIKNSK